MREIYTTEDVECKSVPHCPVNILNTRHFPCQLFPAPAARAAGWTRRTEVLRAPAETEVGKMTFLIESGLLPLPRCHVIRQGLRSQARPSPLYRAAAF